MLLEKLLKTPGFIYEINGDLLLSWKMDLQTVYRYGCDRLCHDVSDVPQGKRRAGYEYVFSKNSSLQ